MGRKIKLTESRLIELIKGIIKEEDGSNVVHLSPSEYMALLKNIGYAAHAINLIPKYRGKEIVVDGPVDLSGNDKIIGLGNITINGRLDVSRTKLKNLDGVTVNGNIWKYDTPYQAMLDRQERRRISDEQEELRNNAEWDINNTDDLGEMANAVYQYAMDEDDITGITEDEHEQAEEYLREIERLEQEQEQLSTDDDDWQEKYDEIQEQIDDIQDSYEQLIDNKVDVYDFYRNGDHYSLTRFKSLSTDYEYAVGTEDDADRSMTEYYEDWVENPRDYIGIDQLMYHVDGDAVADWFEEDVRHEIEENPESYDIEKQLSDDQEEEIWLLEMEKYIFENTGVRFPILYPTRKDGGVFDFMDEEDNSFQYKEEGDDWKLYMNGTVIDPNQIYEDEDTEDHQDDRESRISDIEYEIEEIKENPDGEPDEDSIEEAVERRLSYIRRDPRDYLEDLGFDEKYIVDNFIDKDDLLETLISKGDYGDLNSYNNRYDHIKINDTYYIVMRIE